MPNFYDFSTLRNIKELEINPLGWINPLTVEYGIGDQLGPTFFWRVKGTKHTFVIPVLRLDFISSGDYANHFTSVLQNFREKDYTSWKKEGFSTPWMREYEQDYRNYIL
jgi:hypothetical protein